MGFADMMATKAHNRLKKCAEKEAGKTNTRIDGFERVELGPGGAWSGAAKIMLTRSAQAKQIQIFQMRHADRGFVYVEPFDNAVQLPGEFHVRLTGQLSQPVAYLKSGWQTNEDDDLRTRLEQSPELKKAVKKLRWTKGNQVRVNLGWGLQLRAIGDGTSHLIMQTGSFGMLTESPGIGVFLEIVSALEPIMAANVEGPTQNLYFECYHQFFNAFAEASAAPER